MPRKTPGPPCGICGKPSQARNLCEKHYSRWHHWGDATKTLRPDDWGKREKHPLYTLWGWTKRSKGGRCAEWDDLYTFAADVGEKPSPAHRLKRHDCKKPWGPDNFHWHKTLEGRHHTLDNAVGRAEYQRVWRANNRLRAKSNDLKNHYGISLDRYHEMLEQQAGICVICLAQDKSFAHLAVDHCHKTGRVRGLLCSKCNRGLGMLGDDPDRLRRALIYLTGSIVAPP